VLAVDVHQYRRGLPRRSESVRALRKCSERLKARRGLGLGACRPPIKLLFGTSPPTPISSSPTATFSPAPAVTRGRAPYLSNINAFDDAYLAAGLNPRTPVRGSTIRGASLHDPALLSASPSVRRPPPTKPVSAIKQTSSVGLVAGFQDVDTALHRPTVKTFVQKTPVSINGLLVGNKWSFFLC
jgi:hypothetical protein